MRSGEAIGVGRRRWQNGHGNRGTAGSSKLLVNTFALACCTLPAALLVLEQGAERLLPQHRQLGPCLGRCTASAGAAATAVAFAAGPVGRSALAVLGMALFSQLSSRMRGTRLRSMSAARAAAGAP